MDVLRRAFLPLSLVTLLSASLIVPLPVFLEQPRAPLDLAEVVSVDAPDAQPVEGSFLLTAVNLRRASTADLMRGWLDDDMALVPVQSVVPPGQQPRTFFDDQRELFARSADLAAGIGLEAAGYRSFSGDGTRVVQVLPDAPADGVLEVGDVIVGIDERPVATALDLIAALTDSQAAQPERELLVQRGDQEIVARVTPRAITRDAPQLGIGTETVEARIELPFSVEVDSGRIGGPSAGLMIALTVFDIADQADLAGGRRIAGTGAVDDAGNVLPIGGLEQKVIAAARGGADVFLAPAPQVDAAIEAVPTRSELQVVGVATVEDALTALQDGGEPTA
ncbi:MAG: PDZ domain-containing protein [Nitriliruptorales bacterium]|nr:PDZ domain-containing protein [Nitriliruptorales bacterium]